MSNLFIIFMVVTKSLQYADVVKEEKYCECYDRCQKNFPANTTTDEQLKAACERGCRFYSLVLHASHESDPAVDAVHAKEGCSISCTQSYVNLTDITACNFGCSSMKSADSDICDVIDHGSQNVIEFLFDDSSAVIHLEEPELDDVLIDIALKKQLESSLGSILNPKQKLPEISFRNLPISKQEMMIEHTGATVSKCPRFYELYVKLALRHRKLSGTDLFFVFTVLVFAIMCFIVNRYFERHRKLWKQMLMNMIQNKPMLMKIKDRMIEDDLVFIDYIPEKEVFEDSDNDEMEETEIPPEKKNSTFEGVTLVFYENDSSQCDGKSSHNKM